LSARGTPTTLQAAGAVRLTTSSSVAGFAENDNGRSDRLRRLTARNWGVSMQRRIREINRFTVGWTAYFQLADTFLPFERLDKWLRRRLRQIRWNEWKRPKTRYRSLRALGLPDRDCREWPPRRRATGARARRGSAGCAATSPHRV
jgi:hypothetical protein